MGIRQTGLPLGGALAAATLPAAATVWGWRAALVIAGLVGMAGAVAFALVYSEPDSAAAETPVYRFGPQLREVLRMRSVRVAALTGFVMVSTQFCLVSYLLPFLWSEAHLAPTKGAAVLFAVQASGIAGRVLLAAWSDRTSHRLIPVATAAVVSAAALAGLPATGGSPLPLLVTYGVALGFFAFGWYGPWVVHIAELAPAGSVGLTLTCAMTANQLGIVAGPPLFGLVLDVANYTIAWWSLAVGLAVVAAATVRRLR
jgi:predicted MFS family arabinose efflux permease